MHPRKIGEPEILAKGFGKSLIKQNFSNPRTGSPSEYILFHANAIPVIVMPVIARSDRLSVLVVHQFRYGANSVITEFPGGLRKGTESLEDVALTELLEETGYAAEQLICLHNNLFFEPAAFTVKYSAFLGLKCQKISEPNPDDTEFIEIEEIPLKDWLRCISDGEVSDDKTIAITLLALPYLGVKLVL